MNKKCPLLLISLTLGLISLAAALCAGVHLQHLIHSGEGKHLAETVVLILLALALFAGSAWACQREREPG